MVKTVELVAEPVDASEVALDVVVVGLATFHPTTAIAPTVEDDVNVVVTIVYAVDSVAGVEAYVNVIPGSTVDKQSPSTWPVCPLAR